MVNIGLQIDATNAGGLADRELVIVLHAEMIPGQLLDCMSVVLGAIRARQLHGGE